MKKIAIIFLLLTSFIGVTNAQVACIRSNYEKRLIEELGVDDPLIKMFINLETRFIPNREYCQVVAIGESSNLSMAKKISFMNASAKLLKITGKKEVVCHYCGDQNEEYGFENNGKYYFIVYYRMKISDI